MIEGETGTGKTSIARWLHHHGPRAAGPLVEVNCPALPESLAESELFGHERGAFTDAKSARMGLFEAAKGGTLFLDELASLSLGLQAKVLKAIEDRRIRRLGGNREIDVDVRIIAASNRDLGQAVEAGEFRDDLHHRLSLFRLKIPPLRDRGDDILTLAEHLLTQLCQRHRVAPKAISPSGRARLLGHAWHGNVRELSHELERTIVFEDGDEWEFAALPGGNEPTQNRPATVMDCSTPDLNFRRRVFHSRAPSTKSSSAPSHSPAGMSPPPPASSASPATTSATAKKHGEVKAIQLPVQLTQHIFTEQVSLEVDRIADLAGAEVGHLPRVRDDPHGKAALA